MATDGAVEPQEFLAGESTGQTDPNSLTRKDKNMLRSSVAFRMNGSMHVAEAFLDQLLGDDLAELRDSLHARVHLRDLQP